MQIDLFFWMQGTGALDVEDGTTTSFDEPFIDVSPLRMHESKFRHSKRWKGGTER